MKFDIFILVIGLHYLFDWILQPRSIARMKSSSNDREKIEAVFIHLLINILPFSIILFFLLPQNIVISLLLSTANVLLHGLIDLNLPKGDTERSKINWCAVDQFLHISILYILIYKL